MQAIGITGSIATGKSTVSTYLKKQGYIVLDSDLFSREAFFDPACKKVLYQTFGPLIDDRKALAKHIFENKEARKKLEDIVHPYVIDRLQNGLEKHQKEKLVFLDIPLLYECQLQYLCDIIMVVYCDEKTQIERLALRDAISHTYAKKKVQSQLSIVQKRKWADIVLDNTKSKAHLLQQLEEVLQRL